MLLGAPIDYAGVLFLLAALIPVAPAERASARHDGEPAALLLSVAAAGADLVPVGAGKTAPYSHQSVGALSSR